MTAEMSALRAKILGMTGYSIARNEDKITAALLQQAIADDMKEHRQEWADLGIFDQINIKDGKGNIMATTVIKPLDYTVLDCIATEGCKVTMETKQ